MKKGGKKKSRGIKSWMEGRQNGVDKEWGTLAETPCARNNMRICSGSFVGRSLNKARLQSPLENHVLSTSARHRSARNC